MRLLPPTIKAGLLEYVVEGASTPAFTLLCSSMSEENPLNCREYLNHSTVQKVALKQNWSPGEQGGS